MPCCSHPPSCPPLPPPRQGEAVAICTIEKACVAVSKLQQDRRLGELACVVVDEAHMVADGDRWAAGGRPGA